MHIRRPTIASFSRTHSATLRVTFMYVWDCRAAARQKLIIDVFDMQVVRNSWQSRGTKLLSVTGKQTSN